MSAPKMSSAQRDFTVPESLASSDNIAHKLQAAHLNAYIEEWQKAAATVDSYQIVQSKADDLLKESTITEATEYRRAVQEAAKLDAQDKATYEEAIKPFKEAYEASLKARQENLENNYKKPALQALNLDAGVTVQQYGEAVRTIKEIAQSANAMVAVLTKQGIDMGSFKLPTVSGSSQGSKGFTPKFQTLKINGELQPQKKSRMTDIVNATGANRDQVLTSFLVPWAGDEEPWRSADPGFTHRFTVTKNDKVWTIDVVKASRTKATLPSGEEVEVDIDSDDDDDDDSPTENDQQAAF